MSVISRADETVRNTFLSLRTRNYRLFFFGQLISNTGNWLTNVALTLLVLNLTDSGVSIGLLAACQYGPVLLLSAWAGAVADRSDKRRFLFITQSLAMAQSFGLAALAFLPHPPLLPIYFLAVVGGVLLAFDNPLRRSFVSEMVPPEDLPNAVVLYSLIVNLSRVFGPALAGLMIVTVGYGWCFALDGISYSAVLVCLAKMRTQELFRRPPRPREKGEVRAGIRYVRSVPELWIPLAMLAGIGTLAYNFTVTLPLFVTDTLHRNDRIFTLLYAVFSLGSVTSALIVASRGYVGIRHVVRGAALLGIAMIALALVSNVRGAIPVIFMVGVASILYTTSTTTIVQVVSKPGMTGRVLALQSTLTIGGTLVGAPLVGWLADVEGGRAPIILGGLVCLAASVFGYLALRRVQPSGSVPASDGQQAF